MQIKPENLRSQIRKYKLQLLESWPYDNGFIGLSLVKANSGLRGGHFTHNRDCVAPESLVREGLQQGWIKRHPLYRSLNKAPYGLRR